MINEELNKMIMAAMKGGEKTKAEVYRAIKSEFLKFKTAKDAKPFDDAAEISILRKMHKEREDDAKLFEANGRADLADQNKYEAAVLADLLPQAASEDDIRKQIDAFIATTGEPKLEKKNMGACVKFVKAALPTADGKTVSTIVMQVINS
ncbi:MAG: GatB/YqeY domain-containing protein [Bacteroidales bacterium]|nr:GatB/YqeY domain-containing protein [Bacteroidales bacterium]